MFERDDIDLFDQKVRPCTEPAVAPASGGDSRSAQSVRPVSDGAAGLDGGREVGADEDEDAGEASQDQRTAASA